MRSEAELCRTLARIDRRGYKAYRDISGTWELGEHVLYVDHVQADPFAAPSRMRVLVPPAVAALPAGLSSNAVRRLALEDLLARKLADALARGSGGERRGSGKSGLIGIDAGRQEVLARTALVVDDDGAVEARIQVGLPAAGRRILARQAETVLCEVLPEAVRRALHWGGRPAAGAERFVACVENQEAIREQLDGLSLVAFVGRGALLPLESGASDAPLPEDRAVRFEPAPALTVEVPVPNPMPGADGPGDRVVGLGVPKGVTLVVGGGYHGKSTLLRALERGVYDHLPGDGRERVVTVPEAVKIRAEDGRSVVGVDISPFIDRLPMGRDTTAFSSADASGSTSQAAGIVEAVEAGARVLLLDEPTSATNFLIRDHRMQELIHRDAEPITPLLDKVRQLHLELGVSTILVMGGSGDYFDVADTVIAMEAYLPWDATERAQTIAKEFVAARRPEGGERFGSVAARRPEPRSLDPSKGRRDVNLKVRGTDTIVFGCDEIDLAAVEQLVDPCQARAIAEALDHLRRCHLDGEATLSEVLDRVEAELDEQGLDAVQGRPAGDLARFRRFELAAALNRLRTLRVR